MQAGVDVEISKAQKDELVLSGNSLEAVSQSAADIQQICRVRNKDVRKVRRNPSAIPWRGQKHAKALAVTDTQHSSWTVSTSRRRATSLRSKACSHGFLCALWVSPEWQGVIGICMFCSVKSRYCKMGNLLNHRFWCTPIRFLYEATPFELMKTNTLGQVWQGSPCALVVQLRTGMDVNT